MQIIKLRAHHLLCLRLFAGSGYDADFVLRMTETAELLGSSKYRKENSTAKIELLCNADHICEKCPNMFPKGEKTECRLGTEDVEQKDSLTLECTGLRAGGIYSVRELDEAVKRLTSTQFMQICGTCRWYREGFCRFDALFEG